MDEFPHCCVLAAAPTEAVEMPMFDPTYVELQQGHDVLVVPAPGFAVATSYLASGAKVATIFLYSLADGRDPQDEAVGMGHNMTFASARRIAANIVALCDEAESMPVNSPSSTEVQ